MKEGYDFLQFIYVISNNLKKEVEATLNNIERNLNRPERNDLGFSQSMFNIYKESLNKNSMSYPELSSELSEKVLSEK